ncbi:hypothetical protein [Roseomonas sp. BN140053]|uniref:hypothetical protein n=1 Tax=Roseomonas sp. BN140053 TaxID=3391898 RepID=UPI0039E9581E
MSVTRTAPPVQHPESVRQLGQSIGNTRLLYSPFGTMPDFTRFRQAWGISSPPDIRVHNGRQKVLATLRDGTPFIVCQVAGTGQHVTDAKAQLTPAQLAQRIKEDGLPASCRALNFCSLTGNGAAFVASQLLRSLRDAGYADLAITLHDGSGGAQAVTPTRAPTGHSGISSFGGGRPVPASCRGLNLGG